MANNSEQCFNTHYQSHCHPTTKSLWLCSSVYCRPPHQSRRIWLVAAATNQKEWWPSSVMPMYVTRLNVVIGLWPAKKPDNDFWWSPDEASRAGNDMKGWVDHWFRVCWLGKWIFFSQNMYGAVCLQNINQTYPKALPCGQGRGCVPGLILGLQPMRDGVTL